MMIGHKVDFRKLSQKKPISSLQKLNLIRKRMNVIMVKV